MILLVSGCKTMDKFKKSVTKSDSSLGTVSTSKHGDYLNGTSDYSSENSLKKEKMAISSSKMGSNNPDSLGDGATYKRDYASMVGSKTLAESAESLTKDEMTLRDYNQTMVNQYKSMDQLGEIILFEIGIIERSWQMNANRFKTANANERDRLASELSKLDDDKLELYKAYTKIYKQGKSNWAKVKLEVEDTLRGMRGVN